MELGGAPDSCPCTYGEIEAPTSQQEVDSTSGVETHLLGLILCAVLFLGTKSSGLKLSLLWKEGAAWLSPVLS